MQNTTRTSVTETPAADPAAAYAHFSACFRFETDCWDVHAAMASGAPDFVLLDVRSLDAYAEGHAQGAINLPHRQIVPEALLQWPEDTVFVVYCAGPHCNGASRAAVRLAALERPVKLMIGGMTGWMDEGFDLAKGPTP